MIKIFCCTFWSRLSRFPSPLLFGLCFSFASNIHPYAVQWGFYSQQFLLNAMLYLEGSFGLLIFRFESLLPHYRSYYPEDPLLVFTSVFRLGLPNSCEYLWANWAFPIQRTIRGSKASCLCLLAWMLIPQGACSCQKFVPILWWMVHRATLPPRFVVDIVSQSSGCHLPWSVYF